MAAPAEWHDRVSRRDLNTFSAQSGEDVLEFIAGLRETLIAFNSDPESLPNNVGADHMAVTITAAKRILANSLRGEPLTFYAMKSDAIIDLATWLELLLAIKTEFSPNRQQPIEWSRKWEELRPDQFETYLKFAEAVVKNAQYSGHNAAAQMAKIRLYADFTVMEALKKCNTMNAVMSRLKDIAARQVYTPKGTGPIPGANHKASMLANGPTAPFMALPLQEKLASSSMLVRRLCAALEATTDDDRGTNQNDGPPSFPRPRRNSDENQHHRDSSNMRQFRDYSRDGGRDDSHPRYRNYNRDQGHSRDYSPDRNQGHNGWTRDDRRDYNYGRRDYSRDHHDYSRDHWDDGSARGGGYNREKSLGRPRSDWQAQGYSNNYHQQESHSTGREAATDTTGIRCEQCGRDGHIFIDCAFFKQAQFLASGLPEEFRTATGEYSAMACQSILRTQPNHHQNRRTTNNQRTTNRPHRHNGRTSSR